MLQRIFDRLRSTPLLIFLLILITELLYLQALNHSFMAFWDDNSYVTNNAAIRAISWPNIKIAFTNFYVGNYAPLQILSYMFDYLCWGLNPAGFIQTNIAIHIANGVLFYLVLVAMKWEKIPAFLAALIFLVHPVQVESVAWVSQRKNVLCLFFYLLAFLCYLRYRSGDVKRRLFYYVLALFALALSLLAKSLAVVFPVMLVAFDLCFPQKEKRRLRFLDVIPFLVLAVVAGLVAMKSQSPIYGGGRSEFAGGSPLSTFLTMVPIFARYVGMFFWPTDLSAVYAPEIITPASVPLQVVAAAVLLVVIAVVAIRLYLRKSELAFWLLLFFIGLLPVSQLIPLVTLMQDRYLYLPMLGAAAFVVKAVSLLLDREKDRPALVTATQAASCAAIVFFIVISAQRIGVWKDEHALWQDAVVKEPASPKAHFMLAHELEREQQYGQAAEEYGKGLAIQPSLFERLSLARLYAKNNQLAAAEKEYIAFLTQKPDFQNALGELAALYLKAGMVDSAIEVYRRGLKSQPDWAGGHNNLAVAYAGKGAADKALEEFRAAVKLEPGNAQYHYNLAIAYQKSGAHDLAFQEYQMAAQLEPKNALYAAKLAEVSGKR